MKKSESTYLGCVFFTEMKCKGVMYEREEKKKISALKKVLLGIIGQFWSDDEYDSTGFIVVTFCIFSHVLAEERGDIRCKRSWQLRIWQGRCMYNNYDNNNHNSGINAALQQQQLWYVIFIYTPMTW